MKSNSLRTIIQSVVADRPLLISLIGFIVLCLAYVLFVVLSVRPSDLQISVHYTPFSETQYYRARWYYLLSFAGLGLLFAVINSGIAIKFFLQQRRQLALGFIGLSVLVVIIAWLIARSVLSVAYPS